MPGYRRPPHAGRGRTRRPGWRPGARTRRPARRRPLRPRRPPRLRGAERGGDGGAEVLRRGGHTDVDRVARELHPLVQQRVGDQHAQRGGVAHDGDPRPGGQRLVGQQQRGVEQLGERLDPDDPGLLEQRPHAGVVDRLGVRGEPRDRTGVPPALHRDDRLGAGEPPREPRELARVAERLQVEQHQVGGRVGLPVLQQVVARQVGAVARRDERRQPQTALAAPRRGSRCPARRTGRRTRSRPRPGRSGARVALSRTSAAVLATPSALGPITRMPCARASVTSRRSASTPSGPASANPALTHDQRGDALRQAGVR